MKKICTSIINFIANRHPTVTFKTPFVDFSLVLLLIRRPSY